MELDNEAEKIMKVYLKYEERTSPLPPFLFRVGLISVFMPFIIATFQASIPVPFPSWEREALLWTSLLAFIPFWIGTCLYFYRISSKSRERLMRDQFALDQEYFVELIPYRVPAREYFLNFMRHDWIVREKILQITSACTLAAIAIIVVYTDRDGKAVPIIILLLTAVVGLYVEASSRERAIVRGKRFEYILGMQPAKDGVLISLETLPTLPGGGPEKGPG